MLRSDRLRLLEEDPLPKPKVVIEKPLTEPILKEKTKIRQNGPMLSLIQGPSFAIIPSGNHPKA